MLFVKMIFNMYYRLKKNFFKNKKIKISIILSIYSIVMTIIFICILGMTSLSFKIDTSKINDKIMVDSEMIEEDEITVGNLDMSEYNTMIGESYNKILMNNLFNTAIILAVILALSTFILWRILRKIEQNEMIALAKGLKNIDNEDEVVIINPILDEVYTDLKNRFNNNLNDYKRLNSYLSHEQKNAIAVLKSRLELEDNLEYIKDLEKISWGIDDILTLSSSGNRDELHEVDLLIICAEICDYYNKVTDKIIFEFDDNGQTTTLGKYKWIYRAVSNLVDNAIKYGNDKPIEVSVFNKSGKVVVSVKDYGIGISEQNKCKIFDDRFRISELNKDGYGIGLSLVKHVSKLCDGNILVESEQGKGSVFYLEFKEIGLNNY